jgi:UDP-glucose 4-epimerase
VIGTRHGEKLHEALLSREEMALAIDEGEYFRVPADMRDLRYDAFFEQGDQQISRSIDYNSANTRQLDVEGMKALLLELPSITAQLAPERRVRAA